MSMIPITENPTFNPNMTALETSSPAYAPTFNNMYKQCLENEVANRRDAKRFEDETLEKTFTLGVNNGLLYIDDGEGEPEEESEENPAEEHPEHSE